MGIDLSLTKIHRTRSADCIRMEKRARISPLWEIVYYSDTCIVYLAVCETEYLLRFYGISHACANSGAQAVFSLPRKKRPGNEASTNSGAQAVFPRPRKKGPGTRLGGGEPGNEHSFVIDMPTHIKSCRVWSRSFVLILRFFGPLSSSSFLDWVR